jgi:hypothetical protein
LLHDAFIAAALLERAVGSINGEKEQEEWTRGLVFEDAILDA